MFNIAAPVMWFRFVTKTVDTTSIMSINKQCLHSVFAVLFPTLSPSPQGVGWEWVKKSDPMPDPNWP